MQSPEDKHPLQDFAIEVFRSETHLDKIKLSPYLKGRYHHTARLVDESGKKIAHRNRNRCYWEVAEDILDQMVSNGTAIRDSQGWYILNPANQRPKSLDIL